MKKKYYGECLKIRECSIYRDFGGGPGYVNSPDSPLSEKLRKCKYFEATENNCVYAEKVEISAEVFIICNAVRF